jgi:hypothetical protein
MKKWGRMLFLVAGIGVATALAPPAFAANCMQENAGFSLVCTANDVRIAEASNILDLQGHPLTTCIAGETISFTGDFKVLLGAQARYDIGLYFATDGDPNHNGAISGICSSDIITPANNISNNFIQLDKQPDICGDITAAKNPQIIRSQVDNVLCQDTDGDGKLNLPNCTSWRQPGSNDLCDAKSDAFPGSPSKCNCDIAFNIPVIVENGSITVTKDATPVSLPQPGGQLGDPAGEFTFNVSVHNDAQFTSVTINKICDDRHGTVVAIAGETCPAGSGFPINSTTCVVPQTLAPQATYSCSFKADEFSVVAVNNITDVVTFSGVDSHNNPVSASDPASVAITDVPPAAMVTKAFDKINCANVTYNVDVNNTSPADVLTLTSLIDNSFGDITVALGNIPFNQTGVTATTCSVPQQIAIGGHYLCTFDANFCGSSHTNIVTATLHDPDGNVISPESNSVTVTPINGP